MIAPAAVANLAGRIVVASLWQGLMLAVMAALGLRLAPRLAPATRFGLWMVTLFAMVALPLISALEPAASTAATARPALQLSSVWGFALTGCWLLLVLYRLIELAVSARHLVRTAREAQPTPVDPAIAALLAASGRPVQLCLSTAVDAPCIAGLTAPRLLLPASLAPALQGSDLRTIVLHELEHLRRYDDWFNLASKLAIALFPFNPSLLWLDRRLGLERELACDASVIATTHLPVPYAGSLARLAEHRVARRLALALAAWSRPSEIAQRVSVLLDTPAPVSAGRHRAAVAALSAVLLLTSLSLLRTPQLVSFAPADSSDRRMAMADNALGGVTPAAGRSLAMRTALPLQDHQAQPVLAHLTMRRGTHAAAQPIAAETSRTPAEATASPRALLTVAVPPERTTLRSRRSRSAHPAAQLLQTDFPAFAAVPFGDGWLIVQL